ncbi:hypothetical protein [Rhodanobacter lindaniclasticus]
MRAWSSCPQRQRRRAQGRRAGAPQRRRAIRAAPAQAQIAAAQAAYTEADATWRRFAEIYGKGFVSKAQFDAERARRDAAQAALQSAQAQSSQIGQRLRLHRAARTV